jgi:hypothetical protein
MLDLQKAADPKFSIIPDFVANAGMARTFAYLMERGSSPDAASIVADIRVTADRGVDRLLAEGSGDANLLDRGYRAFLGG